MNTENLTKSIHGAQMLAEDLRAAMRDGGPVASLVLMGMIADAHSLHQRARALLSAIEAKE